MKYTLPAHEIVELVHGGLLVVGCVKQYRLVAPASLEQNNYTNPAVAMALPCFIYCTYGTRPATFLGFWRYRHVVPNGTGYAVAALKP